MKHFLFKVVVIGLVLNWGCGQPEPRSKQELFRDYVDSIRILPTPYQFDCDHIDELQEVGSSLAGSFKSEGFEVLGRIYPDEQFVSIIQGYTSFIYTPSIVTYTSEGDKIDSLLIRGDCSVDLGFDGHSTTVIGADRLITVVDSAFTKKYNNDTDYIPGSDSISISERAYTLAKSGRFTLVNEKHSVIPK